MRRGPIVRRIEVEPRHPAAPVAAVSVQAYAKINLWLHVVGRRADGYHLLDSLVVFADVGDTVVVSLSCDGSTRLFPLVIDGPFAAALPTDHRNLVVRAAEALAMRAGAAVSPVALRLTKRLPPASGIGGGSADAAATLKALISIWQLSMDGAELGQIALSLGADVPVCLAGRPARVGGVGERIGPAPALPPAWFVLANPGIELATPEVFRRRSGPFSEPAQVPAALNDAPALASLLATTGNDLTAAAIDLAPQVGEVLAALAALDGALIARMSGSGATCFAMFAAHGKAEAGAARLRAAQPNWWITAAAMLRG
jgi:4-diphosphocytidyl-2-C-methyl-D-erythritol kinase